MKVYQTDHEGFFVGAVEADPDPLETGNWIIPGGCVTEEPPALTEGQRAHWTGSEWKVVDPVPEPEPEPEPTEEEVRENLRSKRDQILTESDWTQLPDAPVDQEAWANYRQALRDVPQQSGFPDSFEWPTKPE